MGSIDPFRASRTKAATPRLGSNSHIQANSRTGFSRQEFLEKHAPRVAPSRPETTHNIQGSITLQMASCEARSLEGDLSLKDLTKDFKMTK